MSQSHGVHAFKVGATARFYVDVDGCFYFGADGALIAAARRLMARITLDNLRHSYVARPRRVTTTGRSSARLEVADGGAYALLGPSGCGKTTLLNIVSGLLKPTEGRVLFDDVDVTDEPPDQRNIAQVFQFPVVYDTMTVYDNLAFPLRNRGVAEPRGRRAGAGDRRHARPGAERWQRAAGLTADGKQKISLGRGLVRSDVNVIMFDEPLTVIDPHLKWRAALEAQGAAPAHRAAR